MRRLTALQLAVPAVDPLLDELRPMLPRGATVLDPGHISFGYPWLDPAAADAVLDDVAAALAAQPPFEVELTGPHRFPPDAAGREVVWLAPHPAAALHALGWVVADASGRALDGWTPHCSLVRLPAGTDATVVRRAVAAHLPLSARLDTAELHVQGDRGWELVRTLPLGATR